MSTVSTAIPQGYFFKTASFVADLFEQHRVIRELVRNDFRARYLGSFLGITWAFVQPTVTILILWFVFEVGFRTGPVGEHPYVVWLMCGLLPWNFFSDALSNATHSVSDNSYLVKKMVFRVSILPVVKIISSSLIHFFFLLILFGLIFLLEPNPPTLHLLQIPYFFLAQFVLLLGLSWITSAIVIFMKDLGQIIAIVLQFGFWLTPIFWQLSIIPERHRGWMKLNPMFYVIDGYRSALLEHRWFWEEGALTAYYWIVCLLVLFLGGVVFSRLRPHFADVL
jgi:lipopolysaccharide transport system permease protein/teichoic acid transport system permease protein